MLDIQKSILEADLILCEMSDKNPNVFYELGLAHAIGKPAILVSRKEEDIPFDLRHIRVIIYDYTTAGWENKLREDISAAARIAGESNEVWPPPMIPQLIPIGWQKPGNVFWLAQDLCWAIYVISRDVEMENVIHALNQSLHHLREIGQAGGVEEARLSQLIERLTLSKPGFTQDKKDEYIHELRGIIARLGAIAESKQPDYRPNP